MGWIFSLDNANTLAWLTAKGPLQRPMFPDLQKAHALLQKLGQSDAGISNTLVSRRGSWPRAIQQICRPYSEAFPNEFFEKEDVLWYLRALRHYLWELPFTFFAVGAADSSEGYHAVTQFLRKGADESGEYGLFLIPNDSCDRSSLTIFEPFPAFSKFANVAAKFPAVLFWTANGIAHLASLESAVNIYDSIRHAWGSLWELDKILGKAEQTETRRPSFLQISDLHFGASGVTDRKALLAASLKTLSTKRNAKQVVITGDLLNGPKRANGITWRDFNHQLTQMLGAEPIIVPGNHDQKKWWGLGRSAFRELSEMGWRNVVVDDDLRVIFLCFDSSRDARFARGKITERQRIQVATSLTAKINNQPHLATYLRVALLHHHPFSFPENDQGVWRLFNKVGFRRESMLRMDEADDFTYWCALQQATLILHGHKHVPYHVDSEDMVTTATGGFETIRLRSVGCGTSTGVGGWPMSVNCLTWNPDERLWSVAFLVDRGDGSGFREAAIQVRRESNHDEFRNTPG